MSLGDIELLSRTPIIRSMAGDLIDAGVEPVHAGERGESDFVFAAAMEYVYRGGEMEGLAFEDPAVAVRVAYDRIEDGSDEDELLL